MGCHVFLSMIARFCHGFLIHFYYALPLYAKTEDRFDTNIVTVVPCAAMHEVYMSQRPLASMM